MTTKERTLTIRGQFTDDELLDIIAVVQAAEQRRPEQMFSTIVDGLESVEEFDAFMAQVPLPDGYNRSRTEFDLAKPKVHVHYRNGEELPVLEVQVDADGIDVTVEAR